MLRAMGYPARYVEGYAVNSSDLPGGEVMVSKLTIRFLLQSRIVMLMPGLRCILMALDGFQ